MKANLVWHDGMHFEARTELNSVKMDAKPPFGQALGMSPKELVVAGLGGCTAMDVIGLLKKHKQNVTSFEISVDVEHPSGPAPQVFTKADIYFHLKGDVDEAIALESVRLSQTKYCGVSAMLAKAFPIEYHVFVNEKKVGSGQADFKI